MLISSGGRCLVRKIGNIVQQKFIQDLGFEESGKRGLGEGGGVLQFGEKLRERGCSKN